MALLDEVANIPVDPDTLTANESWRLLVKHLPGYQGWMKVTPLPTSKPPN
jgi:hypothetical protein